MLASPVERMPRSATCRVCLASYAMSPDLPQSIMYNHFASVFTTDNGVFPVFHVILTSSAVSVIIDYRIQGLETVKIIRN